MDSLSTLFTLMHLLGLALGLGAATGKLTLLLKTRRDHEFIPVYLNVARPITRLIVLGMVLLTVSGIGWLLLGYTFSTIFVVKLILVGVLWLLGPFIDNVAEPKFRKLAPRVGEKASVEFLLAQRQYLTVEMLATGTFYVIVVMWVTF